MPVISSENAEFIDSEWLEGAFQSTFYGFFAAIFIMSSWIMINKGLKNSRARLFLFMINITMFIICTSHEVLIIAFYRVQYPYLSTEAEDALTPQGILKMLDRWTIVFVMQERVAYFISDSVVVWRTWCIYHDYRGIKIYLSFLIVSTFATSLACGILDGARIPVPYTVRNILGTLPLLLTNLSTTILCAYKVWQYRLQIKIVAYGSRRKNTLIENVLLLLVESGALYCIFWILLHLENFGFLDNGPFGRPWGFEWMMPHFAGIYVTAIILVVAMYQRPSDTVFTSLDIDSVRNAQEAPHQLEFAESSGLRLGHGNIAQPESNNTLSLSVALDHSPLSGDSSDSALADSPPQSQLSLSKGALEIDEVVAMYARSRRSSVSLRRTAAMQDTSRDGV